MKKLAILGSAIISLLTPVQALAQDIKVDPPGQGFKTIGNFVTNVTQLALILGVLVVMVMLIWGAFEWITSGGDKEAVGHARNRIINALIGLAVLAIAFALFTVAGQFIGFNKPEFTIPRPQ